MFQQSGWWFLIQTLEWSNVSLSPLWAGTAYRRHHCKPRGQNKWVIHIQLNDAEDHLLETRTECRIEMYIHVSLNQEFARFSQNEQNRLRHPYFTVSAPAVSAWYPPRRHPLATRTNSCQPRRSQYTSRITCHYKGRDKNIPRWND